MKTLRLVYDTFGISGSGAIFRVMAYGMFLAVIFCGGCSDSAIGTVVGESRIPPVPSSPSNVSAAAASSNGIAVNWPSVSQAVGYNVFRGTVVTGPYGKIGTMRSEYTSYTDSGLSSGTSYHYRVSAYNGGGESLQSHPASAITIPDAPLSVFVKAASPGNITVSWPSVFGAAGYYVYRNTNADGRYSEKVGTTPTASYINVGVLPGTVYYYKVSAYNGGGESAQSPYDSAITVPAAPSGVVADARSPGSISLSWRPVFGATGYNVYRDTNADGDYGDKVGVTLSDSTSCTDTGLASGATYYYKVSAYNDIGEGAKSLYVEAITIISDVPVVSVAAESSSGIKVSWSSVAGAIGYYVYRSLSADGQYGRVGTAAQPASTSFVDTGLLSCTVYYYKVSAYNNTGEGDLSSHASVITAPTPPSRVTAFAESSSEIAVSWGSSPCATGYVVYRSVSAAGTYSQVGTTASTSYTNTGLIWGVTYYYKVSAKNGDSESAQSFPQVDATTGSDPAISVTASAATPSSITVRWTPVPGAEGYYVYRGASRIRTTSSTAYTDNGRTPGTNYCYTVSAYVGTDKESPKSSEACAMPLDTFTDIRNGKLYKAVKINNRLWMAENLNYEDASESWCYGNDELKCGTYGRLYSWMSAMNMRYNDGTGDNDVNRQGICPDGWHLPSRREWGDLAKDAGGTGTYGDGGIAGTGLKSRTGWSTFSGIPNGADNYGFSALPGGYKNTSGEFSNAATVGYWWTASEDSSDNNNAYYRSIQYNSVSMSEGAVDKMNEMSVRCVKDY